MSTNGHDRDVMNVGEPKLGARGKAFWQSVHKEMVGWEDEAIKIDQPEAYQRPSVDASVDSVDAVLNAQKEMLRLMAEKGYPADQIKAVISALGEKSTDGNSKSTDDRQTKDDLATLERRRERDRAYQEKRRRKLKEDGNSSVDASVGISIEDSKDTIGKEESKKVRDSGIRARECFDKFWLVYPKRLGGNPRKPAQDQFNIALKNGHAPETIIRGAEGYQAECKKTNIIGTAYVAHARTWLRQQRWNDYQQQAAAPSKATDFSIPPWEREDMTEDAYWERERRRNGQG